MPTQDELLIKIMEQGSADVVKDLDHVADGLDKVGDQQERVADSAQKSAKGFKGLTVGMADLKAGLDIVSNVGGKVIDFLKGAIDDTMKYAAEVRDLSRAIGANAEETSSLIQVADDVGVSVGTIEAAFKAAIKNGIQPNIETLAKLSDEYRAIQDPVLRSQFAMEKFGRAGLDMAKILEQGGDAIKAAADEAKELGLTLSEEDVRAAREMEIQMDNLGDKFEAVKTSLAKGLIPRLVEFFDTIDKGLKTADLLLNWNNNLQEGIKSLNQELLTGNVSYQEYANSIVNAAVATGQMSRAEADALINGTAREVLIRQANEQLGLLTQAQFSATQGAYGYASALDESGRAAQRTAEAQATQTAGIDAASSAQDRYYAALANAAEAEQIRQAAEAEAVKAEAIHRASIAESITANAKLAQSLKDATTAQAVQSLATAQLDTLKKAYEEGTISQQGYEKATDAVMLRYGLATPVSLAMADAQEAINTAFLEGQLPLNDYIKSTDKIPQIAKDGKVTMQELATLGIKPTTQAVIEETGRVDLMADAWGHVPREVTTVYKIVTEGAIPTGGEPPARAYGGPVSAGMAYMVGERGPEIFIPNASGRIAPNVTNDNRKTEYNITTDKTGMAYLFERQRMAEARM